MPRHRIADSQRAFARTQRKMMSESERALWAVLRNGGLKGWKFKRQVPIGRYTVDFVCLEARLIIEADGPLHDAGQARLHDSRRDAWLRSPGFEIVRLPNDLILGAIELAIGRIEKALRMKMCAPSPSPVIASQ